MERDGMLHVQQIILDAAVNGFRHADEEGLEPVASAFHDTEVQVQLRAERLGTLQSSMWCETEICEPPLDAGKVEVKTMAALVWELPDASWRIIANGGNMVKIGKRDIVNRSTLSMGPFDRNCSFRAVDMSFSKDIKTR